MDASTASACTTTPISAIAMQHSTTGGAPNREASAPLSSGSTMLGMLYTLNSRPSSPLATLNCVLIGVDRIDISDSE